MLDKGKECAIAVGVAHRHIQRASVSYESSVSYAIPDMLCLSDVLCVTYAIKSLGTKCHITLEEAGSSVVLTLQLRGFHCFAHA